MAAMPAAPAQPHTFQEQAALFEAVIKLAAENKITESNTWQLSFIDHFPSLIRNDHTNFQKASCALDASVKIYSTRVDAAYKLAQNTLSGLAHSKPDGSSHEDDEPGQPRKTSRGPDKQCDPESTLEHRREALLSKGHNATSLVDPLFHKTSALFDQGGAQGLLVSNLSVYEGCTILFDSTGCPQTLLTEAVAAGSSQQVPALSFSWRPPKESCSGHITPSIGALRQELAAPPQQLDVQLPAPSSCSPGVEEHYGVAGDPYSPGHQAEQHSQQTSAPQQEADSCIPPRDDDINNREADADAEAGDDPGWFGLDDDGDDGYNNDPSSGAADEEDDTAANPHAYQESIPLAAFDTVSYAPIAGKGWAGPQFWLPSSIRNRNATSKASRTRTSKRAAEQPIDFTAPVDFEELQSRFKRAKPRDITVAKSQQRVPTLPEDVGYTVERLRQLFICPAYKVKDDCSGRSSGSRPAQQQTAETFAEGSEGYQDDGWDGGLDDDGFDPTGDGVQEAGAEPDDLQLLAAPRQVARVSVRYSNAPKQVDIKALKEHLWDSLEQAAPGSGAAQGGRIPFQDIISHFPQQSAVGKLEDLSVHLCFICVLHLANDHGLVLRDSSTLDSLDIIKPS